MGAKMAPGKYPVRAVAVAANANGLPVTAADLCPPSRAIRLTWIVPVPGYHY